MKITIITESPDILPDVGGFLREYIEVGNKTGKQNARLQTMQVDGLSTTFTGWHTKAGYVVEVETRQYEVIDGYIIYKK